MLGLTRRFLQDEAAATAVEYGLIAALLSLVVFAGVSAVSNTLAGKYNTISNKLGS